MMTIYASDFPTEYIAEAYIRSRFPYTALHSDWQDAGTPRTVARLITRRGRVIYFSKTDKKDMRIWEQWIDEEAFKAYERRRDRETKTAQKSALLERFALDEMILSAIKDTKTATVFELKGDGISAIFTIEKKTRSGE